MNWFEWLILIVAAVFFLLVCIALIAYVVGLFRDDQPHRTQPPRRSKGRAKRRGG